MQKPLILVTNDDGVESAGLWAAVEAVAPLGDVLVVGDREVENHTVAVRTRGGEDLGILSLDQLQTKLTDEIVCRGRSRLEE